MANTGVLRGFFKVLGGLSLLLMIISLQGCVYSKPAYSGRVVDAEDGTPLKGVRVDAEYWLGHQTIVEQNTREISRYQISTDNNGYFEIPAYTTLISPFSWDEVVVFSFDKRGYADIMRMDITKCLSTGCDEKVFDYLYDNSKKIIISSHLIKLPKLDNKN